MAAASALGFWMPPCPYIASRLVHRHRLDGYSAPACGPVEEGVVASVSCRILVAVFWVSWIASVCVASTGDWNQWLGGPQRMLRGDWGYAEGRAPVFAESWRRSMGSGYAGVSVCGPHAVTAMTDGRHDVAMVFNAADGVERWRHPLGRTRKRGEGVPRGPLSTPALDAEAAYVQAMDGRLLCLELFGGGLRWEVNLKRTFQAHEPGYGFASSPLLVDDLVVVTPAGSSSGSVVALDRRTGAVRWRAALGAG
ncbi:MAG: PQQ-binding-like beta-propeller repeat protein, partial [Verrucomicrobia bacterium]|nr:PQQ-binding-like beta-propeller repeat protein [Verrucomicrobiota bacterium]